MTRCGKAEEDWEHIWICESNEYMIRQIIEEAIYDYEILLKEEERLDEVAIIQGYNFNFISILYEKSLILTDHTREWELLRGIYNNRFNRILKKKDDQKVIKALWEVCYDNLKKKIWNKRCENVNEIEKANDITRSEKRKRKKRWSDA
ncbi:hypothetical protein RclHR1_12190001 [Rhizophagus clarus]|uniref:Uncharacterized protein n=1 Tax=Rhizophagus clarus TaxID=94130 RepID=A0A2Z6Q6F0_9GLOM|nr:hypothetical protein RclHR1_12190001 [Rhizophagus clarus]GES99058.1 hypothetical protein GLOIN_2v1472883 [Rhizophagus clarus]